MKGLIGHKKKLLWWGISIAITIGLVFFFWPGHPPYEFIANLLSVNSSAFENQQVSNTKDDFGCFSSCTNSPVGFPNQKCNNWKEGKAIQWPYACSFLSNYSGCVKLCEFEKKNNLQSNGTTGSGNYINYDEQSLEDYCPLLGISKDENPDNAYLYIADLRKHRLIRMEDMGGTGWMPFGSLGDG
ncbi:MAG: hypothetical protein Q8Q86_00110, partial [Candidatus Daviesbacteria bacterium]|nr:hypothetical protein [Candidatus Daviesbacteria bacterium]